MNGLAGNAPTLIAALLALAVVLGGARLLLRLRRQEAASRPRAWRTIVLLLAQAAVAVLLYCTLFPPPVAREAGTLVVLTARAAGIGTPGRIGDHVVALPEARESGSSSQVAPGIERMPDLATALRRYPDAERIRVVGAGLVARDRDAVAGRALDFLPAALPRGLSELQAPVQVPAGRQFTVTGRGHALRGGTAELLDPAARRVDRAGLDEDGRFELHGTTRTAGLASYRVRLLDARRRVVDDAVVALVVTPTRPLRVLVLAGAPNAELKYLRRWALDSGLRLDTRISLGAGLLMGSAPVGFDAGSLDRLDLVVLDERSWRALGVGQRAALSAAIDRGLGLLLRLAGPLNVADRDRLGALGFSASAERAARETRLGAGFVRAGDAVDALPTVTRSALRIAAADGLVLLDDAAGTPLAVWRAWGRGRIAVNTLDDSYRLVLAGRPDAHGEVWSRLFTTIARAATARAEISIDSALAHQRSVICGIGERASVAQPDGRIVALRVDPASGARHCAGYWPTSAGWHVLRDGAVETPFHIRAGVDAPGIEAQAIREATAALAAATPAPDGTRQATRPGPRWPWFLAWLLLATTGWWFERTRFGLPRASLQGTEVPAGRGFMRKSRS